MSLNPKLERKDRTMSNPLIKYLGSIPTYLQEKATDIVMMRLSAPFNGRVSHKWKKIPKFKREDVFSYPVSRGYRILQLGSIFAVMHHDLYEKCLDKGVLI
jgi:hypothetical protein